MVIVAITSCSYFETYGSIPELNDDDTEEKFTAMRKVADISTVHKGDNTYFMSLPVTTLCNCVLQRVLRRKYKLSC